MNSLKMNEKKTFLFSFRFVFSKLPKQKLSHSLPPTRQKKFVGDKNSLNPVAIFYGLVGVK